MFVCSIFKLQGNKLRICFFYIGIKESDTGLAPPALWDLAADKQALHSEQPLQVTLIVEAYSKF